MTDTLHNRQPVADLPVGLPPEELAGIEAAVLQPPIAQLPQPQAVAESLVQQPGQHRRTSDYKGAHRAPRQTLRTAVETAVVGGELFPGTNEGSRYGALIAAETLSHSPVLGGVVLGGMTFAVEGAGALAAADLLTRRTSTVALKWLNKTVNKFAGKEHTSEPSTLE